MNTSSERDREIPPASVPSESSDKQAGESLWQVHKAERGVWSEKMLRTLVRGVKGGKWFSLIDKVYSDRTLSLAWEKVKSNAGACGVDGITVNHFNKGSEDRLLVVKEHLKSGTYQPKPVKRARIPKAGSNETRALGIPTVTDRVVQQAVRMVLEPIYERRFAEHSYGFRPGRSCHDALRRVGGQLAEGHTHVVDIDIQGYFDTINQQRLMQLLGEDVSDGALLTVIERFLRAGTLEDGVWEMSVEGTPQGGVISPLLSNLYLDELDHQMEASAGKHGGAISTAWRKPSVASTRRYAAGLATSNKPTAASIKGWTDGYECAYVRSIANDIANADVVAAATINAGPIGTLPSLDCLAYWQPNAKPLASIQE